jgi:hypothetical protein
VKSASPELFWGTIERTYGQIPYLIKLVLQYNGFDSFLALKGIRYDEKNEFFQSLESTIVEIVSSEGSSLEKTELITEIKAQHQKVENFKLKPGHRNYIMNLMMEIEKADVNEFFGRSVVAETLEVPKIEILKRQYMIGQEIPSEASTSSDNKHKGERETIFSDIEHGYSQDQEAETEYIYEEEYLTDDDGMIRLEYETVEAPEVNRKRKSHANHTPGSGKHKPVKMYNEEFIAKCVNPRRRRVTVNKSYPQTDEGTRERFTDLIQQSIECILPREKLQEIDGYELHVEKESETSWAVYCPVCHSRIRLPVVLENGGRYCNYKRSNFERHLRFKHCKILKRETYEGVEIEEIVG